MASIIISLINRNIGAVSQKYRIEYKRTADIGYLPGPTLTYNQAVPAPAGNLPVIITLDPVYWSGETEAVVRIITIYPVNLELAGDPQTILFNSDPC